MVTNQVAQVVQNLLHAGHDDPVAGVVGKFHKFPVCAREMLTVEVIALKFLYSELYFELETKLIHQKGEGLRTRHLFFI